MGNLSFVLGTKDIFALLIIAVAAMLVIIAILCCLRSNKESRLRKQLREAHINLTNTLSESNKNKKELEQALKDKSELEGKLYRALSKLDKNSQELQQEKTETDGH